MKGLKEFKRKLGDLHFFSVPDYLNSLGVNPDKLPYSIRVLVENLLHSVDGFLVREEDVKKRCKLETKTG